MLYVLQASEDRVHFIVSRQTHIPTPDILQEAPWNMEGPPPYSPVDIEHSLLVGFMKISRTHSLFPIPLHHLTKHSLIEEKDLKVY